MHCLNCGTRFKGNYCPHCGQKAQTKRLHLTEMTNNLISSFVGGDNMFMNTCRDLIVRPGNMTRNYLLGKRVKYYNPLQMFVFTLTTYAIVSYVLGISSTIFDEMVNLDMNQNEDIVEGSVVSIIMGWMQQIYSNKLYGTLFAALLSVPSYRWFFCKCKVERPDGQLKSLNYTEHFCAQMYHSCLVMITSIILLPLCLINGSDEVVRNIYKGVSLFYVIFLYKQMLGIGWMKSTILNILAFIFSSVLLGIILILAYVGSALADYYLM